MTLALPKPNGHPAPPIIASTPKATPKFPLNHGLDRAVVQRLLAGRFDRKDLSAYYQTPHFKGLKARVIETYESCVLVWLQKSKAPDSPPQAL